MKICERSECGKELVMRWQKRFCSCSCRAKVVLKGKQNALGHKQSEETKKKRAFALRGRLKGRKLSEETKRKISESLKGKKRDPASIRKAAESNKGKHSKDKSFFWLGGTKVIYAPGMTSKLKEEIRNRDRFTCQCCGKNEQEMNYRLHIHHLDFQGHNHSSENLVSLCRSCHFLTHKENIPQSAA